MSILTVLGVIAVACITVVVYIIDTAVTIGFMEILGIALFGFVGICSMIAFSAMAMGKYGWSKAKKGVRNIRNRAKKLKA